MDKVVYLVDYLVKQMVKEPDKVCVELGQDESSYSIINIKVSENDMGSIIGKGGNIAKTIRTVVQASSYINENKRVNINIDSY